MSQLTENYSIILQEHVLIDAELVRQTLLLHSVRSCCNYII